MATRTSRLLWHRLEGLGLLILLGTALTLPAPTIADPIPLGQLGSTGSGAGQLDQPRGVAVDGAGNIYVAEADNDRVSVFGPNGSFIHAFGWDVAEPDSDMAFEVCPTNGACRQGDSGGGAGQLNDPSALALDGAELYVADFNNHRISVFDVAGPSFLRAFGWDVALPGGDAAFEVCTADCKAGGSGGAPGELNNPRGVAVHGTDLYVAEQNNHRISVFDISNTSAPSFVHTFGWDVDAMGLAEFEVCPTTCKEGVNNGGPGQLNFPAHIAAAADHLHVADSSNHRISTFDISGVAPAFTHAFGWDVAEPDSDMAFEVCPTDGACRQGDAGGGAGQIWGPTGVSLDGGGNLYVSEAPQSDRISTFDVSGVSPAFIHAFGWGVDTGGAMFEVCTDASTCQLGIDGGGDGQLSSTEGLAFGAGKLYAADRTNDRVSSFAEPPAPPSSPPPPPPPPAQIATATPSNLFELGKLKRNKKKAIAFLFVSVPGPGEVGLAGKGVKSVGIASAAARKSVFTPGGVVKLRIKPGKGKAARKVVRRLKTKGKAKLKVRVTYVPTGGLANTQVRKVKLVRK